MRQISYSQTTGAGRHLNFSNSRPQQERYQEGKSASFYNQVVSM
jgi:hypothetical protein